MPRKYTRRKVSDPAPAPRAPRPVRGTKGRRTCSICSHPDREAIETALQDATRTQGSICVQFGVSDASVRTHLRACMPVMEAGRRETLKKLVQRVISGCEDSPMMARVALVEDIAIKMLEECERTNDTRNASAIMGHLLRAAELVGKRVGELVDKRERAEIHHGGTVVLALPQVDAAPPRGVLAAPRDGSKVNPDVARIGTTLDAIEAETIEIRPELAEIDS